MKYLNFLVLITLVVLCSCHKKSLNEQLKEDVEMYNKQYCPRVVDNYTIETSREYNPGRNELTDNFVIGNVNLDSVSSPNFKKTFREQLLKSLRYDISLKQIKDNGTTFRYIYRNKDDGSVIIEEVIRQKEYE